MQDLSAQSNICGNFRVDQLDRNLSHSFINSLFAKFAVGFVLTSGGIVSAQTQPKQICEVKKDTFTNRVKGEVANIPFPKNDSLRMLGNLSKCQMIQKNHFTFWKEKSLLKEK
jgi:hypothetical protein